MERLNLTLDPATSSALARHAKRAGRPRASLARELILEAIAHREERDRRRKLAMDYAAGRGDHLEVLADLEQGQIELLDEEA